ncbi:hypothetical protein E4U21_004951 [Claviceps maximensis]|nr:hypothetical protein E4U21_004951 [Claviceps maximensis]
MFWISLTLLAAVLGIVLYYPPCRSKATLRLPPGPRGLPIVGNVFDLPPSGMPEYEHWLKLKDTYGPISSINVFGTTMVILHSREAVHELLVKNASKTSARPMFRFASMCGLGNLTPNVTSGPVHRGHRKLIHQQMGTKLLAQKYSPLQDVESKRLLLRAMNDPADLINHVKTEAAAIILKIVYGYSIQPHKADPLVEIIEHGMDIFSKTVLPLGWAVDIVPQLRHLPIGIPGLSFHKLAHQWSQVTRCMINIPYNFVRQQMSRGNFRPSYVSHYLGQDGGKAGGKRALNKEDELAIRNSAAVLFGGGSDTTVSSVCSLILAMILHPDIQLRAQKEIDDVVGSDRLPGFQDRDHLPYINALIKETYRWIPVIPIGTTHVTEQEMTCLGYHIPKGSYIIPSIWWYMHDPVTYPNPSEFDPGRFLEPRNEPDPKDHVFGYGRRICPGRYVADDTLYLTISRLIATFNVTEKLDEQGRPYEIKRGATAGLISRPIPFPYSIATRSAKHAELIRKTELDHPWEESDAEHLVNLEGEP